MKKLLFLFLFAFAFIGQQAFSQMYIVTTATYSLGGCSYTLPSEMTLLKIDPSGNETTACINRIISDGGMGQLTQELNSIINQGYKLIKITNPSVDSDGGYGGGLMSNNNSTSIGYGTVWYFAIP